MRRNLGICNHYGHRSLALPGALGFLSLVGCSELRGWAEKAMAPHSGSLAWKIPWTEEPGGLQSMGSLIVGHD